MKPIPLWRNERWTLDLRKVGLGQHVLKERRREAEVDATHEAWMLFIRLRDEAEAKQVQRKFDFSATPPFSQAVDEYMRERERDRLTPESAAYVFSYLRAVRGELGHLWMAAFAPPVGNETLADYRNRLQAQGMSPKTRRNRLNTVMQVLRFAHSRGWLPAIPLKPAPTVGREVLNDPQWRWYTEKDFRTLRESIYATHDQPGDLCNRIRDREERLAYIARRRLWLSFAFYTGMHTRDLDELTDESFAVDFGHFVRKNTKSSRAVPPKTFKAPEQLWVDVDEEITRLGRHWHEGEPICGGVWQFVALTMRRAAKRANLPLPVNPRIMRRSTAYHLCLLGWQERDVAEYLGHVDQQMIRAVYARVPVDIRSPTKLDWTLENMAKVTPRGRTARADVVAFPPRQKGGLKPVP